MFKVHISKGVWTHEESVVQEYLRTECFDSGKNTDNPKVAVFTKELSLPFVPYPGLEIEAEDWDCGPIKTVKWSATQQIFRCTVENEYPHETDDYMPPSYVSFEDLVRMSLEDGWIRPARGGGDAPRIEPKI